MYNIDYLLEKYINNEQLDLKATRDAYGEAMVVLGEENLNVVALNANLEGSVRLSEFTKKFPERSIQVGVAEQNMASIATGLALYGKIPYYSSFAAFSPGLNFSQIRLACISDANIKIASTHYGLNVGADGVTAQMLEDVAMLRALPNMTIVTPADANQAYQSVFEASKIHGPIYLRFTRVECPVFMKKESPFEIGKAQVLNEGNNITLIASGSMVMEALLTAKELEKNSIAAEVLNIHTLKPIDEEAIINSAKKTGAVITIEENSIYGGLGSAVSEVLSQNHPVKVKIIGTKGFGESGTKDELYSSRGLTMGHIVEEARGMVKR